jgi:hypothetical protein
MLSYRPENLERAEQLFQKVQARAAEIKAMTPTNYEYLRRLHGVGQLSAVG